MPSQRRRGYERALSEAGITLRDGLFEASDFTITGGAAATIRLLDAPGGAPTAIFAASDEMAVGAILTARERGLRVPEDLSVIGFDEVEAATYVRLTTVAQALRESGAQGARMVLRRLAGEEVESIQLYLQVVDRGSTAAAGLVSRK